MIFAFHLKKAHSFLDLAEFQTSVCIAAAAQNESEDKGVFTWCVEAHAKFSDVAPLSAVR